MDWIDVTIHFLRNACSRGTVTFNLIYLMLAVADRHSECVKITITIKTIYNSLLLRLKVFKNTFFTI